MRGDPATPIDLDGLQYTVRRHEAVLRQGASFQYKKGPTIVRKGYHVRSELRDKVLAAMKSGKWYTRRTLRETFDLHMDAADSLIQRMMRDGEITKKKNPVGSLLFGVAND